jgi:hypothetical protein
MLRIVASFMTAAAFAQCLGCSWQQAYASAQNWQRQSCYRLVEQIDRDRCLANTGMPYDDYRRRTADGAASSGPSKQ